jgi:hypothetical protein
MNTEEIMLSPSQWDGKEFHLVGWRLSCSHKLSFFADKLEDLILFIPKLGSRLRDGKKIWIQMDDALETIFKSAAIHTYELWTEDLNLTWPGNPLLAKIRISGKVSFESSPMGVIKMSYDEPLKLQVKKIDPLFEGIIEANNYMHYYSKPDIYRWKLEQQK